MTDKHDLATTIAEVMSEVLGDDVEMTEDFFDIGGHSLLVAELVTRLGLRGVAVDVRAVYQDRSPAAIAERLRQAAQTDPGNVPKAQGVLAAGVDLRAGDAPDRVIPLQDGISGRRTVVLHWGNGNVQFVAPWLRAWTAGEVLGVEAAGLRGDVAPLLSITEMAGLYLTDLEAAGVDVRDVSFVGLCQGGLIALEMSALVLERYRVAPVVVVLNLPTGPTVDLGWGVSQILDYRYQALADRFGLGVAGVSFDDAFAAMRDVQWYQEGIASDEFARLQVLWAAGLFAQDHHRPRRYSGPVTAVNLASEEAAFDRRWRPLLPDLTAVSFKGHETMSLIRDAAVGEVVRAALR